MKTQRNTSARSDRQVLLTRVFEGGCAEVFKAFTDPAFIPQLWGPETLTTIVDKMDVRPGGGWRYIQQGPDGKQYVVSGVYREIVPMKKIVYTFEYTGMPGRVSVETLNFEEIKGKTKVTTTTRQLTAEEQKEMFGPGLRERMFQCWRRQLLQAA